MYTCVSFFFFKQKTAYEMRISDWISDVCSSDLVQKARLCKLESDSATLNRVRHRPTPPPSRLKEPRHEALPFRKRRRRKTRRDRRRWPDSRSLGRSEEHTSELQSLMRISYAVFCLKKKKKHKIKYYNRHTSLHRTSSKHYTNTSSKHTTHK